MKKLIALVLLSTLIFTLVGCGALQSKTLSGSYEAGMNYYKVVYTFTEENKVTVRYVSMGNTLYQQDGTYELDEKRENITLTFPVTSDGSTVPFIGMSSLGGTFSFSEKENIICIGETSYIKTDAVSYNQTDYSDTFAPPIGGSVFQPKTLSGSYEAGMNYYKVVYTFTEENKVTIQYVSMGNTLYQQDGTYELDEKRESITLNFPVTSDGSKVPFIGMSSIGGTFSFSEEGNTIHIGEVAYTKTVEDK